jgi:hypothetical protein
MIRVKRLIGRFIHQQNIGLIIRTHNIIFMKYFIYVGLCYGLLFFFYAQTFAQTSAWFPFDPNVPETNNRINMSEWLDAPAGKHGFVELHDEKFVFEDGTPVKFWGVNICSHRAYVSKEEVDRWIPFLAKYGINSVRFHKYTQYGLSGSNSYEIAPDKMERFDYFQYKLREAGIYYGWSPIYGHKVRPGDKDRLLAYEEIVAADMNSHLSFSTIGLVNFADDIQDLHIDLIVNKLNHVNPYTGLRYADDPALNFVEFQNEDNIFFATTDRMVEMCPTYKQLLTDKFVKWLREKYNDHATLAAAWGTETFEWGREVRKEDWNLDEGNIRPVGSHGIYDYEYKKAEASGEAMPRFLLDMMEFMYQEQMKFYIKFEKAIRDTGYKGPLVGSCWQAGSGIAHFYNLHTDYEVGIIDRHNYFGGGTGHRLIPGKFNNGSMTDIPGSGLLSTGMQQVAGRPFALSEWMSLIPNEWIAEGPVIIATYGLGLQGWGASYSFAVDYDHFTPTIHTPGVYNTTSPTQLALYPALVSTLYNGDIKQGDVVSVRNVHVPSLANGNLGFSDIQKQDWDQKEFGGDLPTQAMALGRVEVDFTNAFIPTVFPDFSKISQPGTIKSNTGQLTWNYSGEHQTGNIIINTPSLQGFSGFSDQQVHETENLTVRVETPFAVVLFSSPEPGKTLEESDRWLVTTIARARNTGMVYNEEMTELLEVGTEPILLEPVKFSFNLKRKLPKQINVLDHAGNITGTTIHPNDSLIAIDGSEFKAIYYEIIF